MDLIESSLSIIVFCLAVFAIVWVVRTVLCLIFPKLKQKNTKLNKIWEEFLLPVLPIIFGGSAGGLFSGYPYPELFVTTTAHVFFGLFCGLISGLVYRLIKQNIMKKIGKKVTPEEPGPYVK